MFYYITLYYNLLHGLLALHHLILFFCSIKLYHLKSYHFRLFQSVLVYITSDDIFHIGSYYCILSYIKLCYNIVYFIILFISV